MFHVAAIILDPPTHCVNSCTRARIPFLVVWQIIGLCRFKPAFAREGKQQRSDQCKAYVNVPILPEIDA